MAEPSKGEDFRQTDHTERMSSSRLSTSGQKNRFLPQDPSLFATRELSIRTEEFDFTKPFGDTSDKVLQDVNPVLLAMRNKVATIKPDLSSPRQRPKTTHAGLRST